MNQVNCPVCGMKCVKSGKTKAGSQRWLCKNCKTSLTHKINNESKELQIFLDWLFGKESQSTMSGEGRSFRRKTAKFWDISIYQRMNEKNRLEKSLSIWGDAIVWSDLHNVDRTFDGWD